MPADLSHLSWRRASDLVEALAHHAGLGTKTGMRAGADSDVEHACSTLGLEAENVVLVGRSVREQLRQSAPALLPFDGAYLGLVGFRGSMAIILAPDLSSRSVEIETLRDALYANAEAPHTAVVNNVLERCAIPAGRRAQVRRALLEEQIASERIGSLWQLRGRPGSSFARQARDAGLGRKLILLCGSHVGECLLWLVAWWILGISAFNDRIDRGLLIAWVLTLLSIVPLRVTTARSMGLLGLGLGGLLKQRLLAGALRLETQQVRHQGAGQLLGRVIESDAVESMAIAGGLTALLSGFQLVVAGVVLALGAGGIIHVLLLAAWAAVTGVLCRRYTLERKQWTESRLQMTNDLVENMAGHRTRMVQSACGTWHDEEDEDLNRYLTASAALDKENTRLTVLAPRGWLIVSLAGLAPSLLSAEAVGVPAVAVALGGVLLAHQAFQQMAGGLSSVVGAAISWKQVAELFHAASQTEPEGVASAATAAASRDVMRVEEIRFRYRDRGEPVLRDTSFRISKGDWVLLEGGSGDGKSTLASLMAGSREPESGLLLAAGLDYRTLGARQWRRHVARAPQYHENHIFNETLAFNLLLGRHWPASADELAEAEAVCRELGLGELLARMPAGMLQVVGETGWQLSQGERSRIFIARALLQQANLVILDESFAALDPENLWQCLECVLKRSETLMVVGHP